MSESRALVPVTSVQESRLRYYEWGLSRGTRLGFLDDGLVERLRGPLDLTALQGAVNAVTDRHDALRASYHQEHTPGRHGQLVGDSGVPLQVIDLRAVSGAEQIGQAAALVRKQWHLRPALDAPDQLYGSVVRLADDDHVLALFHPSLMMDHWGYEVFRSDLAAIYTECCGGPAAELPGCGRYADHAQFEREALDGGSWAESLAFWQDSYRGHSPLPELAMPALGDPRAPFLAGSVLPHEFHAETSASLSACWSGLARHGVTPYAFMLSALLVVMHELTSATDIGVLVPAANRENWEFHDTVGVFSTILAPRFRVSPEQPFRELAETCARTVMSSLQHQQVSYHEMLRRLDPERHGRPWHAPALYFDFWRESADSSQATLGEAKAEPFGWDEPPAEQEGFSITLRDRSGLISGSLAFADRILTSENALALMTRLEQVAGHAATAPEATVAELLARPAGAFHVR